MRDIIRRLLPARLARAARGAQARLSMYVEFAKDQRRYQLAAAPADNAVSRRAHPRHLEAQITKDYHRVEKGLALRQPKRPFGTAVEERMNLLLPVAERAPSQSAYLHHALTARDALSVWNDVGTVDPEISPVRPGGRNEQGDVRSFFESRHSVRDFSDRELDETVIASAVELAINSPSVCNRQAWHVRVYREPTDVRRVLSFQNGNRGFGHVPAVALVTVDARLFTGVEERNQGWIEGGIFSMSLVWALHGLGVDSCMLNMSIKNKRGKALRSALNVGENELIIMMIAMGYGRDGHRIARSPHRAIEDVLDLS